LLYRAKHFIVIEIRHAGDSNHEGGSMRTTVTNVLMALGLVVLGVVTAVPLILYSEADDAPGGVVIGMLLIIGAAALGFKVLLRNPTGSPNRGMIDDRYAALEEDLRVTQSQLDELQSQVAQLEEKLAFTQSLLEGRTPARPALPPRA
jgi:hypothetical protein